MDASWLNAQATAWLDNSLVNSILFGAIIGLLAVLWVTRRRNLPPGPRGLPIFGFLPFLRKDAYVQLHELSKSYGPVFSFYLGPKLVVVLNNFKAVKEALTNNNVMDRPNNPPNHLMPDSINLSVSNGTVWKEQRDFTVQILRRLGMGKSQMEDIIKDEICLLFDEIQTRLGKPLNLDELLLPSVSNNILSLLLGQRLDFGNKDRKFLNEILRTMVLYFRPTRIHAYFPWLRKWMTRFQIWGYDRVDKLLTDLGIFIEKEIDQHLVTFDTGSVRDYIDGYLNAMSDPSKSDSTKSFTRKMLKGNVQSLLGAGSTPARASIAWTIVAMVTHPEIQKRVQMELDLVVSRDRLPSWNDHTQLPYTMAVIMEVLRKNTVIPISMLRTTSAEARIGGYDIPKGAIIMTNIWGIHHDPEYWKDPHQFRPERFIKDSKLAKPTYFMPFSYGKRKCPGEDMALMEVFLYVSCLFHKYTIVQPSDTETNFKEDLGVAWIVFPDNLCVYERA